MKYEKVKKLFFSCCQDQSNKKIADQKRNSFIREKCIPLHILYTHFKSREELGSTGGQCVSNIHNNVAVHIPLYLLLIKVWGIVEEWVRASILFIE